jgi:hypothetical protein
VLSKRKTLVQDMPVTDMFDESMDTPDVTEEQHRWPVTEIAVSSLWAWQNLYHEFFRPADCHSDF